MTKTVTKRGKRYAHLALGWLTWKALKQVARQKGKRMARKQKRRSRR